MNMKKVEYNTKLSRLLLERNMSQSELITLIESSTGKTIRKYQISKIVNGLLTNYHTDTAKSIANALNVQLEDILEDSKVEQEEAK